MTTRAGGSLALRERRPWRFRDLDRAAIQARVEAIKLALRLG